MFSFAVPRVNIACATSRARDVEDADVETHKKTAADKCCTHSAFTREPFFISSKSNFSLFDLGRLRQSFDHGRCLLFSAAVDDDYK